MKKCLKCLNKVKYKDLCEITGSELREGKVRCPHCNEFNYVTRETIVDFNHVMIMPFGVLFVLLFSTISFGGYLLIAAFLFLISKYMRFWFIDFADESPFDEIKK